MNTGSEGIWLERKGPLAMVLLRRPDRLNAFNQAMFERLEDVVRELSNAPLPRAVILTGAGSKAFCCGFDVNPDNPMVAEMARAMERGEMENRVDLFNRNHRHQPCWPAPAITCYH